MNGQPSPVPSNQKTHRLRIVVLILVVLGAMFLAYRQILARSIQARIDAIHQAGFPATCAELDKWYPQPPTGENAADVYSNAFAHYQLWTNKNAQFSVPVDARDTNKYFTPPKSKRDLLPIVGMARLSKTEPLSAETQKMIAEYLADNEESLRLLHEAASMKSCRYPIDLTNGVSTLLPHLNPVRQAARLLELEAIRYTENQQPQLAAEAVIASLRVSQSLDQEPVLISYLVHVACQGITLESLERMLNRISLKDAQLATLAAAIEESENQQVLTRTFVGERCFGVDVFQGLLTGRIPFKDIAGPQEEDSLWSGLLIPAYRATGLLELDEGEYLDTMKRNVTATRLAPPEDIAAFQNEDEKLQHLAHWQILSRMLLGGFDKVVSKGARCDAKIRDAQVAVAIERCRLANDKLPTQLSDLVPTFLPAVPSDPFDGKPLRYKTLAKGYMVYSVGDDREDNGGTEKNNKGQAYVPGTDITFTVER